MWQDHWKAWAWYGLVPVKSGTAGAMVSKSKKYKNANEFIEASVVTTCPKTSDQECVVAGL